MNPFTLCSANPGASRADDSFTEPPVREAKVQDYYVLGNVGKAQ